MSREELYHTIETIINNKHKQNWRITKLVEQLHNRFHQDRYDLINDSWIEFQTYPHEQKPKETDIQSVSRFIYNFLRRKKLHLEKTNQEVYLEEIYFHDRDPQAEPYNPELTPEEIRKDKLLDALRRELTPEDIKVLVGDIGLRQGASIKGMRQHEYKRFLNEAVSRVKQRG